MDQEKRDRDFFLQADAGWNDLKFCLFQFHKKRARINLAEENFHMIAEDRGMGLCGFLFLSFFHFFVLEIFDGEVICFILI